MSPSCEMNLLFDLPTAAPAFFIRFKGRQIKYRSAIALLSIFATKGVSFIPLGPLWFQVIIDRLE